MRKISKIFIFTLLTSFIFIGSAFAIVMDQNIAFNSISEPFTMFLLGVGLIGIAEVGRQKGSKTEM